MFFVTIDHVSIYQSVFYAALSQTRTCNKPRLRCITSPAPPPSARGSAAVTTPRTYRKLRTDAGDRSSTSDRNNCDTRYYGRINNSGGRTYWPSNEIDRTHRRFGFFVFIYEYNTHYSPLHPPPPIPFSRVLPPPGPVRIHRAHAHTALTRRTRDLLPR